VIGGAPAAAVVFSREVDKRTRLDPRVASLEKEIAAANDAQKRHLRGKLAELRNVVRSEKLGEVAEEFDHIHSVHRMRIVSLITDPRVVDHILCHRESERCRVRDPFEPRALPGSCTRSRQ